MKNMYENIKGYSLRLMVEAIPENAKKIGDFQVTETQGFDMPNGGDASLMFDACRFLIQQAKPYMHNRLLLVMFLKAKGILPTYQLDKKYYESPCNNPEFHISHVNGNILCPGKDN